MSLRDTTLSSSLGIRGQPCVVDKVSGFTQHTAANPRPALTPKR
jgi:hypothetical protein